MTYYGESLEGTSVSIGDDMEMRQNANIPMAAMWTWPTGKGPRASHVVDILGAASVAHIYGQNLVAAESLTYALVPWGFSPRTLKPVIDLELALGVNRPVIHTSVHQPIEKKPGLSLYIFGQYFNRHETWAEQAGPWVTYISRNAYLLQQGKYAADVAYFYGEEAPLAGLYGEGSTLPKDLPTGYGFDFVNSDALLHQMSASPGAIATSSGMRYRLLYLGGSSSMMTLPVLKRIRDLVAGGAVVAGERPIASPSLADDAAEFNAIADALWRKASGKGKVLPGSDVNRALTSLGIPCDFDYDGADPERKIRFIHRRLSDGELYFLSNAAAQEQTLRSHFRVTGKRPELWHADTGLIEPASFQTLHGRITVPLHLAANESVFVVFQKDDSSGAATVPVPRETTLATLDGAWDLQFAPNLGAPERAMFSQLDSWPESADLGVKYYSGTVTYHKPIEAISTWMQKSSQLVLDLGDVHELAEVFVNGSPFGIAWHPPYRVNITAALRPGMNTLDIKATNLWVNRLIGDRQPGAAKVSFTAMATYKPDAPLLPSGLLGPVTIKRISTPRPE